MKSDKQIHIHIRMKRCARASSRGKIKTEHCKMHIFQSRKAEKKYSRHKIPLTISHVYERLTARLSKSTSTLLRDHRQDEKKEKTSKRSRLERHVFHVRIDFRKTNPIRNDFNFANDFFSHSHSLQV